MPYRTSRSAFTGATRAALAAVAVTMLLAAPASAQSIDVTLLPDNQVPPIEGLPDTMGQFQGEYDADTGTLTYTMGYTNLTGAPTAAHLHGPADATDNAGVLVPLDVAGEGEVTLTAEQAEQLAGGLVYVNVHTEANPDGEVRGQITME